MNWEAAGAIGEILGAVFVFASLLYLAVQVRQSSRSTLSQSINNQAQQLQNLSALQSNPEMMIAMKKIYAQQDEPVTFEEAALLEAYFSSGLALAQAQYQHHRMGLNSNWEASRRLVSSYFATDFVKSWWKAQGAIMFEAAFVSEVDEILAEGFEGDFWTNFREPGT